MNIKEIFAKGQDCEIENIIKSISVNWNEHANGILNLIKSNEPNYEMTANHKYLLKELLLYFTGNSEFKGSLNKGILLTGSVGGGKSLLLERIFKHYTSVINQLNSYHLFNFKELSEDFKIKGDIALNELKAIKTNNKTTVKPVLIDDLGSGNFLVKNYGNDINLIDTIIDIRYLVLSRYRKITHATSNLYISDFKTIVDDRTISRMSEMFNILELEGKDYRKNK
ncbi:MAG: hypothetical protein DRI95_00685 [Bacteroidetes bacterium]|nr:MAG: hypothetical protein DRI95_00685 [Bacteroidota bacterium]